MAQRKELYNCGYIQVKGVCYILNFGDESVILPRWKGGPQLRNGCSIQVIENEDGLKSYALSNKEKEFIGFYTEKKDGSMEFKCPIYEPTQDRNLLEKPKSYETIDIPAKTMKMVRANINNTENLTKDDPWNNNNKIIFEKHGDPAKNVVTSALLLGCFGAMCAINEGAVVPAFFGGSIAGSLLSGCYYCGRDFVNKLKEKVYKNAPVIKARITGGRQ